MCLGCFSTFHEPLWSGFVIMVLWAPRACLHSCLFFFGRPPRASFYSRAQVAESCARKDSLCCRCDTLRSLFRLLKHKDSSEMDEEKREDSGENLREARKR